MSTRTYLADCVSKMREYADDSFDLAVVDPPYFSGPERRRYYGQRISSKGVKRVNYDITETWEIPGYEYFTELFRVSKNQIVWGENYFDWAFGPGRIIWDKVNQGTSYSDCEIAFCSIHDSVRLFRYMWNGMCQGKSISEGYKMQGNKKLNEKRIHPTQKPIALYRWIFETYAKPGEKILDTHLGSGSSRIAADMAGLDFTGIELNEIHYINQERRFAQYKSQIQMQL